MVNGGMDAQALADRAETELGAQSETKGYRHLALRGPLHERLSMDQELPRKTPASRLHRRALPPEPPRRNERTGARAAWLVPVLLLACSGDPAAPPQQTPEVPVVPMAPVVPPENAVDKVVVPLLRASGREPSVEVPEVLCRRLAIDLTGATPSMTEVTQHCTGRTPTEMVDYFMSKPQAPHVPAGNVPYAYVGRRAWSEIFGYRVIE